MATIVDIKRELGSIEKISKITNAMKIVAISKIARAKRIFLESIELNRSLYETTATILSQLPKTIYAVTATKNNNTL
jgi:F0F1-type ATP synthase gamma subunit